MTDQKMKIVILSRDATIYSTNRLRQAAVDRGHEVLILDPLLCYMDINSKKPGVLYKNNRIDNVDAVIPRIGASITFYATAVLRQFEMMGVYCLNESVAISRSRDKLRALQLLARKGVGLPSTGFGHSTQMTEELINLVGGAPLVIKLLEGTQGKGVVLAETNGAAHSVIDAFRNLNAYFLVQEFIREAKGSDIRCFVVNGKVIATMKRIAKDGEFRSNLHRGGRSEKIKITPEQRETAVHAAQVMGLNVAGVDLVLSDRGSLVLEVNSSPGLEGIERTSGVDVATKIIEFIEKNARPHKTKTRGQG